MTEKPCTLALLLPGLCGPPLDGPAPDYFPASLPALERLLSRARIETQSARELESILAGFFRPRGAEGVPLAVAPLTWLADSSERAAGYLMRADPVHLRADQACLRLFDSSTFSLDAQEAHDLVVAFNDQFRQRGWQLQAPLPPRWYLTLNEAPQITTVAPQQFAGRDIRDGLPQGNDGATWRAFLNEVQMLFYDHPVNQARETRGEPAVNSIWPWGGGRLPDQITTAVSRAFGDHPLLQGLARLAGIPCHGVPENAVDLMAEAPAGLTLVLLDRLERPWRYGELETWASRISELEQRWFRPLRSLLEQGRIARLDLYPLNGKRYTISRHRLRYFWKPDRPLAWHCGYAG